MTTVPTGLQVIWTCIVKHGCTRFNIQPTHNLLQSNIFYFVAAAVIFQRGKKCGYLFPF